ncbi:MAG: Lipoprotein-releasing system ATP-binding protein LolD [Chlamydiae bacterium]|nr:Lipoprotein-releasing system ATP-binding protein LolD [Chlamydiota bacterium]
MILYAEKLHKKFPGIHILKGISLEVQKGETVAIMGKSGEGKSTLLHLLGTLDTPTSGTLRICGKEPTSSTLSTLRNKHIGFIFQAYHLLEDFTTLDNVLMPLKIGRIQGSDAKKRALTLLQAVGLESREKILAKFLSGGEKQRAAIARALINQPDLILADEPTGNLDQTHSLEIQKLLLSMAKESNTALIVVTHDEEFAKQCDRLLFLKGGQIYNQN